MKRAEIKLKCKCRDKITEVKDEPHPLKIS
jgi:hypothetical protein